jgi:hypothetical protein
MIKKISFYLKVKRKKKKGFSIVDVEMKCFLFFKIGSMSGLKTLNPSIVGLRLYGVVSDVWLSTAAISEDFISRLNYGAGFVVVVTIV